MQDSPAQSRSLRRSLVRHDVALVVAGAAWVLLLVWQVLLGLSVDGVRAEAEARRTWIQRAELLADDLRFLSTRWIADPAGTDLPRELRSELGREGLLWTLPTQGEKVGKARKRWALASRRLLAARDPVEGARRTAELEEATAALTRLVRRDLRAHTVDLEEHLTNLFRLAAVLFAALAIVTYLLARSKRQVRALATAQSALLANEERLRALLKLPQGVVWSTDTRGRWTYLSEGVREVYGHRPKDMVGRLLTEFVPAGRVDFEQEFLSRVLEAEGTLLAETIHLRADGDRMTLLMEARALRDDAGRPVGVTGVAMDVTTLHRMRQNQLHGERLQALGTLAGGVAHDFNNLLGAIQCSAEFAQDVAADAPEEAGEALNDVISAANRARDLIKQLLTFARRRRPKRTTWNLADLASDMEGFLARVMDADVGLVGMTCDAEVPVHADRGQIEQAVVNLVLNSRDALSEGGTITLAVGRRRIEAEEAQSLGIRSGEWAVLEVRDDGVGMDDETQRRAFEPFFTTKEQGEGTGLGLASVHGIVLDHGGAVHVKSALGKGTTIQIQLPLVPVPEPAEAPAEDPAEAPAG